ncbi:hypothetical protein B566_EDAN015977 [Ephemera danica]|nr:hypothetical protein B566_EDAN015977 [Ephemera danica]
MTAEVVERVSSKEHLHDVKREHGIGVVRAIIFITANVAGSGVLALPNAVSDAGGWLGIALLLLLCVNAAYAGTHLGHCWGLLEKYCPELRGPVRNPYPTIGDRAYGTIARRVVVVVMQLEILGAGTVFLLLSSQMISGLLSPYTPNLGPCLWLLIVSALVCPAMWLGTPKDFWGFGVMAMLTTLVACTVSTVQSIIESSTLPPPDTSFTLTTESFFLGFGTILFAFGGSATFPTIQNDMRDRRRFPTSVAIAFVVILAMYLPVAISGFAVFGHGVESNILDSLTQGPAVTVAEVMVATHLITTFVIMTNPATQYFEMLFHVPPKFGWKRCLLRTMVLLLMVFVGETIQDFGKVLALVGGSTSTLNNLVFPPLFYLRLTSKFEPHRPVPLFKRIYLYTILAMGVIGGLAATYSALLDIFSPDSFRKPCYVP